MKKTFLGVAAFAATAAPIAMAVSCAGETVSFNHIFRDKTLTVGAELAYAPYNFKVRDEDHTKYINGTISGLTPALKPLEDAMFARAKDGGWACGIDIYVANKLINPSVTNDNGEQAWTSVTFVPSDFAALIPKLKQGEIDVIIAGMSKTPTREEQVSFSDSYYTTHDGLLMKSTTTISNVDALKGKKIGVQAGTEQAKAAHKLATGLGASVMEFKDTQSVVQALQNGDVDVFWTEDPAGELAKNQRQGLNYLASFDFGQYKRQLGGNNIALPHGGDTWIKNKINPIVDNINKNEGEDLVKAAAELYSIFQSQS